MAKASARPMTIQLVMMRLTKTESCLLVSKANARKNWSTMITRDAMIVICTMMRMLLGMMLRIRLTAVFDRDKTKITAKDMVIDVSILVVTAKAEQIPKTCIVIGF